MLCPECRRMVGKDGYCPEGHLARPELAVEAPKAPAPAPPVPPPPPVPSAQPAAPETFGPEPGSIPPGLGPSNPEPSHAEPSHAEPSHAEPSGAGGQAMAPPPAMPGGAPPLPPDHAVGVRMPRRRGVKALVAVLALAAVVIAAIVFLGGSAGASNLKLVFTSGETHTYSFEITVRGRAGNLSTGGFASDSAIAAELTQRTGAVDEDGSARLTYTIRNIQFSAGGRSVDAPPGSGGAFSVKIRPDGKIVGHEGGDPFGLEDVNPVGQFVNPANAGPLLPDRRVSPGQKWTVEMTQKLPDIGTVHMTAVNTLMQRLKIDGNDAAVIRSVVTVPLNIHIGRDALVKQAKNDGEQSSDIPGGAGISMVGGMHFNLMQTIFTANGLLQSALGDVDMRGTMTLEGLPGGSQSIVFDLDMSLTMTKKSTGQSA